MAKCKLKPQWVITSELPAQIQRTMSSVDKAMEQLELLHIIWERINKHSTLKNCSVVSTKAKQSPILYKGLVYNQNK